MEFQVEFLVSVGHGRSLARIPNIDDERLKIADRGRHLGSIIN